METTIGNSPEFVGYQDRNLCGAASDTAWEVPVIDEKGIPLIPDCAQHLLENLNPEPWGDRVPTCYGRLYSWLNLTDEELLSIRGRSA